MIVLHDHKMVFVKTRKTAGSSVEIALSTLAGPDDVITPSPPDDEALRLKSGGRPPQNYRLRIPELRPRHVKTFARCHWPKRFTEHSPAATARDLLGQATWENYFTFTIERNPWDKLISKYAFNRPKLPPPIPGFSEWLNSLPTRRLTCFDMYSDGENIIVDKVLLYERLEEDLAGIWERMGATPPTLPRAKSGYRGAWERESRMFSDEDAELVARACHREIAAFGYTFQS